MNSVPWVGKVPAEAGTRRFFASVPAMAFRPGRRLSNGVSSASIKCSSQSTKSYVVPFARETTNHRCRDAIVFTVMHLTRCRL